MGKNLTATVGCNLGVLGSQLSWSLLMLAAKLDLEQVDGDVFSGLREIRSIGKKGPSAWWDVIWIEPSVRENSLLVRTFKRAYVLQRPCGRGQRDHAFPSLSSFQEATRRISCEGARDLGTCSSGHEALPLTIVIGRFDEIVVQKKHN